MWLTVTAKTSLCDFSLTGHKEGSVWSHCKWPQIFSTEHLEILPREKERETGWDMWRYYYVSKAQFHKLLFSFHFFLPRFLQTLHPSLSMLSMLFAQGELQTDVCYLHDTWCHQPLLFTSTSPAPHPRLRPIIFVGTQNQAGTAAAGNGAKLKLLLNI